MKKRWLVAMLGFALLWQQCGSLALASEVTEPVVMQQELEEEVEEKEPQQENAQEETSREEDSEKAENLEEKAGDESPDTEEKVPESDGEEVEVPESEEGKDSPEQRTLEDAVIEDQELEAETGANDPGRTVDNPVIPSWDDVYFMEWGSKTSNVNCYNLLRVSQKGVITVQLTKPVKEQGDYGKLDLTLYDSDNDVVWECETAKSQNDSRAYYEYSIGVEPGIYYFNIRAGFVVFSGESPVNIGYVFSFAPNENCEIEPNDTMGTADWPDMGKMYTGYLGNEGSRDTDYWAFYCEGDKEYVVYIDNYGDLRKNINSATLETPDGTYWDIEEIDDGYEDLAFGIYAPYTGIYYLKVESKYNICPTKYAIGMYQEDQERKYPLYDDMPETSGWRYDAVEFVTYEGIMNGISGTGNFAPDAPLTRAMFATIIYRMEGQPTASYSGRFPDVPNGNYFSAPISWTAARRIMVGHSNTGLFGTHENITREDLVTVMYRYAATKGYDRSKKTSLDKFADASQVSGYAREAMQWAVANGIIKGRSNTGLLDPKGNATRVETAAIIQRFMSNIR